MEITKIKLQNFRPYYGETEIQPTTESGKPVILIRGKNDTGKTSLFRAIKFCLYGSDSRDERDSLINRRAATESAGTTSVELTLADDEEIYIIKRAVEYEEVASADDRQASGWYREVRTPSETLVSRDASEDEYTRVINQLLPKNIADFFLFDAEELKRFEEGHDEEVRESIETILGIQEIENAIADLEGRRNEYDREYANVESTIDEVERMRTELQEKIDEIEHITGSEDADAEGLIDQKEKQIQQKKRSLQDVREALKAAEDTEDLQAEVDELTEDINTNQKKLETARQERDKIRKRTGPIIGSQAANTFDSEYEIEGASGEAEVINSILNGDRESCICGETVTSDKRQQLQKRYMMLTGPRQARLNELQKIVSSLDINVDKELERYQHLQSKIQRLTGEIESWKEERDELETEIDNIEREYSEDLKDKEDTLKDEIKELDTEVDNLREEVGGLKRERDQLRERIQSQEGASEEAERYQRLSEFAGALGDTFDDIKEKLVSSRRESVERTASEAFKQLTNRPDYYDGLTITDNYELRVRTSGLEGGERSLAEQNPSAGQTQIIVYSFIAGLSRYTTRNAPVVIDTPIGRLDPEHKRNLINFYDEFSEQVIILYQPGELGPEDLERMADVTAKHFEITIQDDETSSTITETEPAAQLVGD